MNRAIKRVGIAVVVLLLILVGQLSYFQVVDAKKLANDPNNVRSLLKEFNRSRGEIQTADGEVVARSVPSSVGDDFKFQRVYPTGGLFAQITGYQSLLGENTGVESTYNSVLTGRDKTLNLDNIGGVFSGKQDNQNVVLSLSKSLQQLAADQLDGRKGSIVVLDVKTGAVLAMYSNPTYDPNVLASHDTKAVNDASFLLNADPAKPLLPRSYAEIFPPGSTFKTVTSIASIDAGISTPDRVFPSSSSYLPPQTNQAIQNFGGDSCGGTMTEALVRSCNVVFAQLGFELGNDFVPRMANCGVAAGDPPPLDLANPGAAASIGPPAGSFDDNKPSFALAGIGQGPVATTPLEMAMVAAAIGNGGVMMTPHVAAHITDTDGKVLRRHRARTVEDVHVATDRASRSPR